MASMPQAATTPVAPARRLRSSSPLYPKGPLRPLRHRALKSGGGQGAPADVDLGSAERHQEDDVEHAGENGDAAECQKDAGNSLGTA